MRTHIGLTGLNASGKGEAASFLKTCGFRYHSLSDVVRREATRLGRDHSRESLIETGNQLRATEGTEVLARRILPDLTGRDVIDSIRHPDEIAVLNSLERFFLLGIEAPVPMRFERSRRRGRIGDGVTLEEFQRLESRELAAPGTESQQLLECLRRVDGTVANDDSLELFRSRVEELLRGAGFL